MERELKFRAWSPSKNKWRSDWSVSSYDEIFYLNHWRNLMNDDLILCQYINHLDKKRKEIFDKDIIRFGAGEWYNAYGRVQEVSKNILVEWGRYGWEPFVGEGYDGLIMYHPSHCEIIGNFFENPELLKDEKSG
ncbi:hypothetical protein LCGC14_2114880 [marine sediment metagenome]|uniref:YopX protein domain-containing protein n=1 Tax=marine sediment metagenome TaxID=412755 RepID=A0A0F9E608_9ZZZZ